jgi:chromosome segregation ATPase
VPETGGVLSQIRVEVRSFTLDLSLRASASAASKLVSLAMTDDDIKGLRRRLQSSGEDTLGKLAEDLLNNPVVTGAISRVFEAREKAVQAQEVAFNALNIPSAADIERLTRRLRSVSQRLEGIEDGVDRLDQRLEALNRPALSGAEERLTGIESQIAKLAGELGALSSALDARPAHVPREQERLEVDDPAPAPKPKATRSGGGRNQP